MGGTLYGGFVVRVGCQAATNQGRRWRQVGVAPEGKPWPPELQLQVEWPSGSWRQGEYGPGLCRVWRGQSRRRQRTLGQGRLSQCPSRQRDGGSGEAETSSRFLDERAGRVWRPERESEWAGSRAEGVQRTVLSLSSRNREANEWGTPIAAGKGE